MAIGFFTGLCYIIAIVSLLFFIMLQFCWQYLGKVFLIILQMYAISDYDALFDSAFPIAEIYRQATGSASGAIGLLCLLLFCVGVCMVGVYITAGRTLWALARDGATPFPHHLGKVSPRLGMPLIATFTCGCIATILGW